MKSLVKPKIVLLLVVLVVSGCSLWRLRNPGTPSPSHPPTAVKEAPPLTAVDFVDPLTGWAAGKGVILHSTDGGTTWTRQYSGSADIAALDFVDATAGWARTSTGLLRTKDGGVTWSAVDVPGQGTVALDFASKTRGWLLTDGSVYQSNDGGVTWNSTEVPVAPTALCFSSETVGWLAAGKTVYRTDDGAKTWTRSLSTDFREGDWRARLGCSGRVVYVLFADGGGMSQQAYVVFQTLDDGATWQPVLKESYFSSAYPAADRVTEQIDAYSGPFDVVDDSTSFFLGFCGPCDIMHSVTRTVNAGKTWDHYRIKELKNPQSVSLSFIDDKHGWIAATQDDQGIILGTSDGGGTWKQLLPGSF